MNQPSTLHQYHASTLFWRETQKRVIAAASLIVSVLVIGTIGYTILEGWNLFDSFYMTVITIATVGFHEVAQLSKQGRVFTVILIFMGIGTASYSIGTIVALLVEGKMMDIFRGHRMVKEITALKNHIIICGYGKIGREVCESLFSAGEAFIVIDTSEEKIDQALELGYLAAIGDATDDDILIKAGIQSARGLISAISDNSANIYLVLTARALNDTVRIVARGVGESYKKKMLRAGANAVVSPFEIGARRMAALMLKPEIVEFLEAFAPGTTYGLRLERLEIAEASSLIGKRLDQSYIKHDTGGALVLGTEKIDDRMVINPPGATVLEENDVILALGNDDQLYKLKRLTKSS